MDRSTKKDYFNTGLTKQFNEKLNSNYNKIPAYGSYRKCYLHISLV